MAHTKNIFRFSILALFLFLGVLSSKINAQVNEPTSNEVYAYLYRMSQKGLVQWNDYELPMCRRSIYNALALLKEKEDKLSVIEKKELAFYLRDFEFDNLADSTTNKISFLDKTGGMYRTAILKNKQVKIFVDPLIGFDYFSSEGKSNKKYFGGIRFAGYLGKNVGINFSFRDYTEKGDSIDFKKSFSSEQGMIASSDKSNYLNYSKLNFNIGYTWKKGVLSIGKDNLQWGYGQASKLILSDKAPSFMHIKLDYYPWKWLHFNYYHAWLSSDIIDSSRSYNTGFGIYREVFRPKFMAAHSLTFIPSKRLSISLGESVVYSDKADIGYLIPINFFRAYDHDASNYNNNASSNSQFFVQVSSRNHIPKTHLYGSLFIDELRVSDFSNPAMRRNQTGFSLGLNRTDFFVQYLGLGIEYTRIFPFVYSNIVPAEYYTHHNYLLGDWMGNNADRKYVYLTYTPLARLKLKASFEEIRKGGPGTTQQQYVLPQPPFLFDYLFTYRSIAATAAYAPTNKVQLLFKVDFCQWKYTSATEKKQGFSLGIQYGL
jgi:hypothetical protein